MAMTQPPGRRSSAPSTWRCGRDVGLIDWSASIGPVEITGPGSLAYLQYLCTNDIDIPVGTATYTLILTPRGTVKRDVTIARLDEQEVLAA